MKIISLIASKGGCGKSTSAVNVSAILAEKHQVLLVDGDEQESSYEWLEGKSQDFEIVKGSNPVSLKKIRGLDFDYCVIDTPPRPSSALLDTVTEITDLLIIPSGATPLDLKMAMKLARTLSGKKYRLLLTRVDPRSINEAIRTQQALIKAKYPTFKTLIRAYKVHERAPQAQLPINKMTGEYQAEALNDYRKLTREIVRLA